MLLLQENAPKSIKSI